MKIKQKAGVTLTQVEEKDAMATHNNTLDRELFTILLNIQEKLNSPVFNGGFDTLVASVEDIKKSQHKTEEHITSINKTIYEPDEGLFSRIKAVEHAQSEETASLKNRVKQLEDFRSTVFKTLWLAIPAGAGLTLKAVWDVLAAHVVIK